MSVPPTLDAISRRKTQTKVMKGDRIKTELKMMKTFFTLARRGCQPKLTSFLNRFDSFCGSLLAWPQ
jgi:hypothetical protein